MKKSISVIVLSVALSALTAYGVVRAADTNRTSPNTTTIVSDGSMYRTVNLNQTEYPDFTYAAESAVDAVVFVKVTIRNEQNYDIDPFLRYFFGFGNGAPREQQGSGSGVIIRPDGYIVTNNHVVSGATKIEVTLNNNKTYEAKIIGTDPATDVALIKVDAEGLPTVPFGDSDKLRLGEWVLAIGSPLGYELRGTITAGIVSAKGRSMGASRDPREQNQLKIESFIQTDAAVNPGNSGGALVNKAGELVGINTAIVSQTGAYSGYSFAVPVNIVKKIVDDLIDFGSVRRAVLGVRMGTVTEEMAKELKLSVNKGVYIGEVSAGSAADQAGIKKGDVILSVDGEEMKEASELQVKVNSYRPGDTAKVLVNRDGKEKEFTVTFAGTAEKTGTVDSEGLVAFYGSKLRKASDETLSRLGVKQGVEVVSVGPGKLLDAGAAEGFVILRVNDEPVSTPQEVVNLAKKAKRTVYIEGVTVSGRTSYFAFGKEE